MGRGSVTQRAERRIDQIFVYNLYCSYNAGHYATNFKILAFECQEGVEILLSRWRR